MSDWKSLICLFLGHDKAETKHPQQIYTYCKRCDATRWADPYVINYPIGTTPPYPIPPPPKDEP